jgi:hypothetical protein
MKGPGGDSKNGTQSYFSPKDSPEDAALQAVVEWLARTETRASVVAEPALIKMLATARRRERRRWSVCWTS